jgi:hypothetical protein
MRKPAGVALAAAAVAVLALPALAAHESNNRFDLAPTATAPGADGSGFSNWIKGQEQAAGQDVWHSRVSVSGLVPGTAYTFYAENATATIQTPVCALTTDARGDGSCSSRFHEEPALAAARIRLGSANPTGTVVLMASGAEVGAPDNKVEDGEIERYGDCRAPDQGGETCNAPGQD